MEGINNMYASDIAFDLMTWAIAEYAETGNRIKASKIKRISDKYLIISKKRKYRGKL